MNEGDTRDYDWYQKEKRERINRRKDEYCKQLSTNAPLLMNKGIELEVEGEIGIGGLFSSTSSKKFNQKYMKTGIAIALPALKQIMALPRGQHLPILQSLFINDAPPDVIKSIVNQFPDTINTVDSSGKYPINGAVDYGLAWNDGMKKVVEGSSLDILEEKDVSTVFYPFMITALGNKENGYDFDILSVFHLIMLCLEVVKQFDDETGEGQHSKKRKRK